jgi:tetratricopeptide (TPR) repeat protein
MDRDMKMWRELIFLVPLLAVTMVHPSSAQDQFTACILAHLDTPGLEEACGTVHMADSIGMGKHELLTGRYADAIPYLERAHDDHPHDPSLLTLLAYVNEMLDNRDLALMYYKRSLDEDPDFGDTYLYLGRFYLKGHDLPSAKAQLDQLARLCPSPGQNAGPTKGQLACLPRILLSKMISAYEAAPPPAPAEQPSRAKSGTP